MSVAHQPAPAAAPAQPAPRVSHGALSRGPVLRRKCRCSGKSGAPGGCSCKDEERTLRRSPLSRTAPLERVPSTVQAVLQSPGQPLRGEVRADLEHRFSHDFSRVRVHTGATAARSAGEVDAEAYTVGHHIVFGAGRYQPITAAGRRLMAHELTHVVQQAGSTPALQSRLRLGAVDDPAEREADRVADQVVRRSANGLASSIRQRGGGATLRRTPQGLGWADRRPVTLPAFRRGDTTYQVTVTRYFQPCPCRTVSEEREGTFYNDDLDNLAIAFRWCSGSTALTVYGRLRSDASSSLPQGRVPTGTVGPGIRLDLGGRAFDTRLQLDLLGSNRPGTTGLGGRFGLRFQGDQTRVSLGAEYFNLLQGPNPNVLNLNLGVTLPPFSLFGSRLQATLGLSGSDLLRKPRGLLTLRIGGAPARRQRQEVCQYCLCPAPVRKYVCDIVPTTRHVREPRQEIRDHHYYFRLDRTSPSEEGHLRARSQATLSEVASIVGAGGRIVSIIGHASPEAPGRGAANIRYNRRLSMRRARRLHRLLGNRLTAEQRQALPQPQAGGELIGNRPSEPGGTLGQAIRQAGFRSAEELTRVLAGETHIPNRHLAQQFLTLFNEIPNADDRLRLLGFSSRDAEAPQVLQAIDQFINSRGLGRRPWESVFRHLRFGVIRTTRQVIGERAVTVHGRSRRLTEAQCRQYHRAAEQSGRLGPVSEVARLPRAADSSVNSECDDAPSQADRDRGCDYGRGVPGRRTPPVPAPRDIAPHRLR